MAKTVLGKVGMTPRGSYSNVTEYKRLDVVTYDGCSYVCLKTCTGIAVTNTEYWQLIAEKGIFTEQDKESFKQAVVAESKTEMDTYTNGKKTEIDNYVEDCEDDLKSTLDSYETTKETELNGVASDNISAFNRNAESKTSDFNTNATNKTNEFNTNATTKTTEFNDNATEKIEDFNSNVTNKTEDFDNNASQKTLDFNNNAVVKTNEFNENADEVINTNNKITKLIDTEFDTNTAEGTTIDVDDSAEWDGSICVGGNTEQATSILPEEYTQVDYIESHTTEYIDTGVNADYKLSLKAKMKFLNTIQKFMGAMKDDDTNYVRHHFVSNAGETGIIRYYTNVDNVAMRQFDNNIHEYNIDVYNKVANVDGGSDIALNYDSNFDTGLNYYLFARNKNTQLIPQDYLQMQIYNFKMYVQGTLVRDFIPCYRNSDNVVGLYDLVNSVFYENQGSGAFTYSSAVAVPNPEYPQEIKVVKGDNVIKHVRKNVLPCKIVSGSRNGLNWIVNDDGTILVNGTATAQTVIPINNNGLYIGLNMKLKNNTDYYISSGVNNGSNSTFGLQYGYKNPTGPATWSEIFNNKIITIQNDRPIGVGILVRNGITMNNVLFKPMVEEGTKLTTYEPYQEDNYRLDLGGKNLFNKDVEKKNAYPSTGIGYAVNYTNSSATDTYVNCCRLEKGKTYTFSWKQGETPVSTNKRIGCIVDDNNVILSTFDTWESSINHKTITPSVSGYLILPMDKNATDIQIEEGTVATEYSRYMQNPIELCKKGDYEDVLLKNVAKSKYYNEELEEGAWYKRKVINNKIFNESRYFTETGVQNVYYHAGISDYARNNNIPYCTHLKGFNNVNVAGSITGLNKIGFNNTYDYNRCYIAFDGTLTELRAFLSEKQPSLYYANDNPTYEKITDPTLISQLEELLKVQMYHGVNHFYVETDNLEPNMELTYKQSNKIQMQKEIEDLKNAIISMGGNV